MLLSLRILTYFIWFLVFCFPTSSAWQICDQTIQLSINAPHTAQVKGDCAQYFSLDHSKIPSNTQFLLVELLVYTEFQPYIWPAFLGKTNAMPLMEEPDLSPYQGNDRLQNGAFIDYHAYRYRSSYARIVLSSNEIETGSNTYFLIYDRTTEWYGFQYEVRVTASNKFSCPKNCSNHGVCDEQQQRCLCSRDHFGRDCSVYAIWSHANGEGDWFSFRTLNQPRYFFIPGKDLDSISSVFIQKFGNQIIDVHIATNDPGVFDLPKVANKVEHFTVDTSEPVIFPLVNRTEGDILVEWTFVSGDNKDSMLFFKFQTRESYYKTIWLTKLILICIGVPLLVIHKKYKKHVEENQRLLQPNNNSFDQYFLKKRYNCIMDSYAQKSCSVCLEDFEPTSECCELYCHHVFHVECIKAWLAKRKCCPYCMKRV